MLEKPILESPLITLRPLEAADADIIFRYLEQGDEEVDSLTGTQGTFTLEQVKTHYARLPDAPDRSDYAIIPNGAETLVGEVVLNDIDWDNRSATFRIALFQKQFFGKGYGSEATRLIIDYGFKTLKLHRIELEVYSHNPRAQHVYEKAGFVREGVRRDALNWNGEYHDAIIMGILEGDYRKISSDSGQL